jgi:hypothetical protein
VFFGASAAGCRDPAAILPRASLDPTAGRPCGFCRIGYGGLMPLLGLMRNMA